MNPVEHLWDEVERHMKKHQPKNEDQLRRILEAEWEAIGQDVTKKLVESVPNRLYECYRMKERPTRYQRLEKSFFYLMKNSFRFTC